MVGKALAMLGFVRKLSGELWALYVSLVRPKLGYASCVWWPFYDVHVNRISMCRESSLDTRGGNWDGGTCMIFLHTWNDVL
jgi:hypothetical protein